MFHWPSMNVLLDEPRAHKSFRDMDIRFATTLKNYFCFICCSKKRKAQNILSLGELNRYLNGHTN
jgi:hypothetical protein